MLLVIEVAIAVIIGTAVIAAACYLTDQTAERHDNEGR